MECETEQKKHDEEEAKGMEARTTTPLRITGELFVVL